MDRIAIELHDSELASIRPELNDIRFELRPAYIHKSAGIPGTDSGQGGWQDVDIVVRGTTVPRSTSDLPADLDGGSLSVGVEAWNNVIPIPLERNGSTIFELELMNGRQVTIQSHGVSIAAIGEANFCETFRGL